MSRELVSALWFEDVSFLNEQILDTPAGRFSIRQMLFFLTFGLLAYIASLGFNDLVLKVVVGGATFFVGATIALWKIHTLPIEVHLLYLVRRHFWQAKQNSKTKKPPSFVGQSLFGAVVLSASLGVPLRLSGILKDVVTGEALADKTFNIHVNNQFYSQVSTDQEGYFSTYFIPEHIGQFQISITHEDSQETLQQITVNVNPIKETDDEVKENAETKAEPKN